MKYEKGKFLRRRNDGQVSGIHTDVGQKLLKNGSSIKARLLWSVTNLPPFYERVWAMAATIVKRELCTSSQWPKSFSMNDTQIQWEFRHKMLKDRWRKSKSSKTCLPPTPTSQINQRGGKTTFVQKLHSSWQHKNVTIFLMFLEQKWFLLYQGGFFLHCH